MSLSVNVADNLNNLADTFSFAAGIPISTGENLDSFGDSLDNFSAWTLVFGETLSIKEKLFIDFLLTVAASDNIGNLADTLASKNLGLQAVTDSDTINNLSDSTLKTLSHDLIFLESIVGHADKVELLLEFRRAISEDTLDNWLDAVVTNFQEKLEVTVGDSMTLTDSLVKLLTIRTSLGSKAEFDDYVRKYLSDPLVGS